MHKLIEKIRSCAFFASLRARPTVCQLFLLWQWWMVCFVSGSMFAGNDVLGSFRRIFDTFVGSSPMPPLAIIHEINATIYTPLNMGLYFSALFLVGLVIAASLILIYFLSRYFLPGYRFFQLLYLHVAIPLGCVYMAIYLHCWPVDVSMFWWNSIALLLGLGVIVLPVVFVTLLALGVLFSFVCKKTLRHRKDKLSMLLWEALS